MNLYICEKPSLAKALFIALGGNEQEIRKQQRQGFFKVNNDVVTFCFGHMLELFNPEDFDPKYKVWDMDHLPFRFELKRKVKSDSKSQYQTIAGLIKKSTLIINVGDPDEEGQLLIDEILEHENYHGETKRLLIADVNQDAIKKSLDNISNNSDYKKMGEVALARSISDQLFGFNLTRAYTLAARKKGLNQLINIGRVQTSIINLIDERCKKVENHVESYYFNLLADFKINGTRIPAKYIIKDSDPVNEKGKIEDESFLEDLREKITWQPTTIINAKHKTKEKFAPMPYTMATLQADCARKFGITAQETLDAAQKLYETHKVLSYPRSNCSYLGDDHFSERHSVLKAIAKTSPVFSSAIKGATSKTPHRAFNSSKMGAHYGIIPTKSSVDFSKLSDIEKSIYNLVARRYVALLYPPSTYNSSKIILKVADLQFGVEAEQLLSSGFEVMYSNDADNPDLEEKHQSPTLLNDIKTHDVGTCETTSIEKKKSPKPKYFVESTLLRALTHIAPYIQDTDLRKTMDDYFLTKNIPSELGTEATRASIIENVFQSPFAVKEKVKGYKELAMMTTPLGKELMTLLPNECKKVEVTASWVKMGADILEGNLSVREYVDNVYSFIEQQVDDVKNNGLDITVDLIPCPTCKDGYLRKIELEKNTFFGCTNHPDCSVSFPEYKGSPYTQTHNCEKCGNPLVLRKSGNDYFFGCTGYKDGCKNTLACVGGKPAKKVFARKKKSTFFKKRTKNQ